jgi:hypothetical protein
MRVRSLNRFSGFQPRVASSHNAKTAEAVKGPCVLPVTPLKRDANANGHADRLFECKVHAPRFIHRSSSLASHPSTTYVPLNVHSYYSFLDSTLSIDAIIDLAKRYELPAIALTDKRNLHGAVEFAEAAAKAGIKAIIGAELEWRGQRLCLYVENQQGYHNLCRILSEEMEGEYPKLEGRRPKEIRNPKSEVQSSEFKVQGSMIDVRCSPASSGSGLRPSFGLRTSASELPTEGLLAVSPAAELAPFFPDGFYLEVSSLEAYSKRPHSLPCVASFPIHY